MLPASREAGGELCGRTVSWPDAGKTLSQSTPGLSIRGGIGKPRVSDFSPGSPGMCVFVYTLRTWAIRLPCEAVS